MAEAQPVARSSVARPGQSPPELPGWLADPRPVILVGSLAWLAATLVFAVLVLTGRTGMTTWLWTTVAGWVLGAIGYGIFRWQLAAAGRGSRTAQRGLPPGTQP